MKKILVGLDGSPRERDILDAAIALGRRTGAKVLLFRSVGVPYAIPLEALAMTPQDLSGLLEKQAKAELDKLADEIPAELRAGARVATGTAWDAICRTAQEEDADIIVIGSHGYGAIDRLLGTTAAKVINHADRSVLVVRAPEKLALA
jgi:nucleotide-binding universal stress UspA family protein